MGRPGFQLTDWDQVQIGDVVHFFTGAGWRKGTVQKITGQSVQVLHTHGSKDTTVTTSDIRNLRSQTDSTRAKRPEQSLLVLIKRDCLNSQLEEAYGEYSKSFCEGDKASSLVWDGFIRAFHRCLDAEVTKR